MGDFSSYNCLKDLESVFIGNHLKVFKLLLLGYKDTTFSAKIKITYFNNYGNSTLFTICCKVGITATLNHSFLACQILFLGDGCGNTKYLGKYAV